MKKTVNSENLQDGAYSASRYRNAAKSASRIDGVTKNNTDLISYRHFLKALKKSTDRKMTEAY